MGDFWSRWKVAIFAAVFTLSGVTFLSTNHSQLGAQSVTTTPSQGPKGATGATGPAGAGGATGPTGPTGSAGPGCSTALAEQCAKLTTATDGTVTWTYPTAYGAGVVPVIEAVAVGTSGSTNVVNVQMDGAPTNTAAKFRVTLTQVTSVSLLGLNILSVPASPGAVPIHVTAKAP